MNATILFVFILGAWVTLSEPGLLFLSGSAEMANRIEHIADLVFVVLAGLLLYGYLSKSLKAQPRALDALRQSERRYHELVEHANSIILHWTHDGRITFLNEFGQRFFGYSLDEVVGRHVVGTIVPENDSAGRDLRPLMDQIAANPAAFEHNINENIRRNGEFVWIAWTNKFDLDSAGQVQGVLSIGTDITELKKAEAALQRRALEMSALNLLSRQVSASLSLEHVIQAVLRGVSRALMPELALVYLRDGANLVLKGMEPEGNELGRHEASVHALAERLCALAVETDQTQLCADVSADLHCSSVAGESRGIRSFAAFPIRGDTGVIGALGLASASERDFAEQRTYAETLAGAAGIGLQNALLHDRLEHYADELHARVEERTAELAAAKDRAESADRLKSAFLATMSHELRTPLNSIIGFTGIVLQGLSGPLNSEQEKQLKMVQGSARHLLALINDVLDISKIEADQLEIVSRPFDVRESIEKVVHLVTPLAEKKGLALGVSLAPEVGTLCTDRRRFEQIALNLINNAVKFTKAGSVCVECTIDGTNLITCVKDTGIGVKPEDMEKLFQTFRQLDTGLTRNHEGSGLGLSICKKLVERMGGTIWAESEWGTGSAFTFRLPLNGS